VVRLRLPMAGRPSVAVPNSTPNVLLISFLVGGLVLVCACDGRDISTQEHRPPVAEPQMTENSAQDAGRDAISLAFRGSLLIYGRSGGIRERFYDDGRWSISTRGRVQRTASGTWTARHGRICVQAEVTQGLDERFPPFRTVCRAVRISNRLTIEQIENLSGTSPMFWDVEMRRLGER
jgi:hypothetical protein